MWQGGAVWYVGGMDDEQCVMGTRVEEQFGEVDGHWVMTSLWRPGAVWHVGGGEEQFGVLRSRVVTVVVDG